MFKYIHILLALLIAGFGGTCVALEHSSFQYPKNLAYMALPAYAAEGDITEAKEITESSDEAFELRNRINMLEIKLKGYSESDYLIN